MRIATLICLGLTEVHFKSLRLFCFGLRFAALLFSVRNALADYHSLVKELLLYFQSVPDSFSKLLGKLSSIVTTCAHCLSVLAHTKQKFITYHQNATISGLPALLKPYIICVE